MVEIFKTDILHASQASQVLSSLSRQFPHLKINFDLADCDNILRVEGRDISSEDIVDALVQAGYRCEVLV